MISVGGGGGLATITTTTNNNTGFFLSSNIPLKKIKQVHFGLFSPDEIVSVSFMFSFYPWMMMMILLCLVFCPFTFIHPFIQLHPHFLPILNHS